MSIPIPRKSQNARQAGKCIIGLLLLTGGLVSCTSRPTAHTSAKVTPAPYDQIQTKSATQFANAILCKPSESANAGQPFQFAPLLMQETVPSLPAEPAMVFKAIGFGKIDRLKGTLFVQPDTPAIYYEHGQVRLRGEPHEQWTYRLYYEATPGKPGGWPVMRGIRMTCDRAQQPVIWELLGGSSGADILYIARSLEDKAAAQFGAPVSGRRYAIEQSPAQASQTIVARVIEDGPLPMGPVVYVDNPRHDIVSVLCRCMPAQTRAVSQQTVTYDLLPQEIVDGEAQVGRVKSSKQNTSNLEQRLRLPSF